MREEALNRLQPISRPHPPILLGGEGERKTMRFVAQYADACNFNAGIGLDGLRHKLQVLQHHCLALGRRYEEIERTALGEVDLRLDAMSIQDVVKMCRQLAESGVQHLILNVAELHTLRPLELLGSEVIPAVAKFGDS